GQILHETESRRDGFESRECERRTVFPDHVYCRTVRSARRQTTIRARPLISTRMPSADSGYPKRLTPSSPKIAAAVGGACRCSIACLARRLRLRADLLQETAGFRRLGHLPRNDAETPRVGRRAAHSAEPCAR